jgi:hypothetical protein
LSSEEKVIIHKKGDGFTHSFGKYHWDTDEIHLLNKDDLFEFIVIHEREHRKQRQTSWAYQHIIMSKLPEPDPFTAGIFTGALVSIVTLLAIFSVVTKNIDVALLTIAFLCITIYFSIKSFFVEYFETLAWRKTDKVFGKQQRDITSTEQNVAESYRAKGD